MVENTEYQTETANFKFLVGWIFFLNLKIRGKSNNKKARSVLYLRSFNISSSQCDKKSNNKIMYPHPNSSMTILMVKRPYIHSCLLMFI